MLQEGHHANFVPGAKFSPRQVNLIYLLLIRRMYVIAMDEDNLVEFVWFTLIRSSVVI